MFEKAVEIRKKVDNGICPRKEGRQVIFALN